MDINNFDKRNRLIIKNQLSYPYQKKDKEHGSKNKKKVSFPVFRKYIQIYFSAFHFYQRKITNLTLIRPPSLIDGEAPSGFPQFL